LITEEDQDMPGKFVKEPLLLYSAELANDVPEEQMYRSFGPGLENHTAFTLGHLVIASALVAEELEEPYSVPKDWDDLFRRRGPGDARRPGPFKVGMPSCRDLLSELERKHRIVESLILGLSDEALGRRVKWRFDSHYPSLADYLHFMCVTHEAMHLGQLAAWRRAAGLDSALARL
jgi:hypothetical protein